ncbi:ATP-binding protein, partial [bacterium]|nr:ATP-binding protein [bacterium]
IQYDPGMGGYFITHDIYEEWALGRVIEIEFHRSKDHVEFFQLIGTELPIRRAFRQWLSENLYDRIEKVRGLIECTIADDDVASYWQDEIFVSVLLSNYADTFFDQFKNKLMENNQGLLMRIVFLLRIACKDIDEDFFAMLGITKKEQGISRVVFTKPKGNGWDSTIHFIYTHKEEIKPNNANIIIPLLDDWINKNKTGETTKKAGQIALYYYTHYADIADEGRYRYSSRDQSKRQLIRVVLNGASELSDELSAIFNEVISNKWTKYQDKYYDIITVILSSIVDGSQVVKDLPRYVLQLAELFWHQSPKAHYDYSLGVEPHFGLSGKHDFHYFPSSALQTPIFQLLQSAPSATTNFILSFTNRAVEYYKKSELGREVSVVKVLFDDNKSGEQYISDRLWNMYRGTHVSTDLLQSMHMALERWLLMHAKFEKKEIIESWCLYLLKQTKSASITAIVASICLAYPSKLFNVSSILFKTRELFLYDTGRMSRDQHAKGTYSIGLGWNHDSDMYQNERIKTCDDPHRGLSLEHLAFKYQLEQFEEESADEFTQRQRVIWEILDMHYANLSEQSIETDADKTWRLFLARMDRRKMKPEVEKSKDGVVVTFNPEIDPDLRRYSEGSISVALAAIKHTPLKIWATYRFDRNPEYQQYPTFEDNPGSVISETGEILENLESGEDPFPEFNHDIPAYTCSVLIRDFMDKLTDEDKNLCKDIVIQFAKTPLSIHDYQYQIGDGTEPSISTLPILMQHFPEECGGIKSIMTLLLLNPWREITAFASRGILY